MYQYKDHNDTIAAVATPAGQSGIGMVRVSGPGALAVADRNFRAGTENITSMNVEAFRAIARALQ